MESHIHTAMLGILLPVCAQISSGWSDCLPSSSLALLLPSCSPQQGQAVWGSHSVPPVRLLCRLNYLSCVCALFLGAAPNPRVLPGHAEPALPPTSPTHQLEINTRRAPGPTRLQLTTRVAPTPVRLHLSPQRCSCPQKITAASVRLHPPPVRPYLPL